MLDAQLEAIRQEALVLANAIENQQSGKESGLADVLEGDSRDVVTYAERVILGRAVTLIEAFLLGRMLQGYNPQRVKAALDKKRKSKDPIRHAYGLIMNAAMGRSAPQVDVSIPPPNSVNYRDLDSLGE